MVLIYNNVILLFGVSISCFKKNFSNGQEHSQGVMKQLGIPIFIMVVSCSVFCYLCVSIRNCTCLEEITFFVIGWTLFKRWRNLTIAQFFEWQKYNSAIRKAGDPYWHVTGTCRHVTEKHCRTYYQYENSCNCSKVAIIRCLNSNSQMDRCGLVLDSKWEIFYTITFV